MNYKEYLKNTALKGLYLGVVWYAVNFIFMYALSKATKFRAPFIALSALGQITAIVLTYGFVNIIIDRWQTSKQTKALVIGLSLLVSIAVIAYDLIPLLAMSA